MGIVKTIGWRALQRLSPARRAPSGQASWSDRVTGLIFRFQPRLGRRRLRAQVEVAGATLAAAASRLQEVSSALEKEFLATGESLEQLNQRGQQFMRESGRLVLIAIGQSEGKEYITGGAKVVEEPLLFLERCLAESERLQSQLRGDHQGIAQLLGAEATLRRTMAPLRTIQTLFKIECAPLGAEAQTMFTALTQEIERMHNQVCELFDTKFAELQQVEKILDEVGVKLEHQTLSLRNFVTKEKTEIQGSLRRLSAELVANQQREVRIQNLSREVTREIQGIIVGLQFQDIINQKLQHTSAAVKQILERVGEEEESLQFVAQSCRLEAQQLQAVRGDLAQAEQTVKTGIRRLLEHLSEADVNCLSLREFDQITASSDGMIQVLLGLIEAVRARVNEMFQRTAEIEQPLAPIHNMAAGLTVTVRQLSYRIHLIGLNAQVQAAHFRHGAGLEVLSARTSDISLETNRISETVATHLDQLAAGLNENVRAFHELHLQAEAQQNWLANPGAEAESRLHQLRNEALRQLQDVGDLLDKIQQQAGTALEAVNYVQTGDAILADLQGELQALGEAAVKQLGSRHDAAKNVVEDFQRHYTMDSERQVHHQVVHGTEAPAAPAPAGLSVDAGVDWFGAEVASAGSTAGKPSPPDDGPPASAAESSAANGQQDEVEFFGLDAPAPPAPAANPAPPVPGLTAPAERRGDPPPGNPSRNGRDLGDNIELF